MINKNRLHLYLVTKLYTELYYFVCVWMNGEWINIHLIYIWFTGIIIQIDYMCTWKSHVFYFCMYGVFRPTRECLTHLERTLCCRWRASNLYRYLTHMTTEQCWFLSNNYCELCGAFVYDGHLQRPVTLAPITERLSSWVVTTCFYDFGLSRLGFEQERPEYTEPHRSSEKQFQTKLESPSSKNALCQIWFKLAQWF